MIRAVRIKLFKAWVSNDLLSEYTSTQLIAEIAIEMSQNNAGCAPEILIKHVLTCKIYTQEIDQD